MIVRFRVGSSPAPIAQTCAPSTASQLSQSGTSQLSQSGTSGWTGDAGRGARGSGVARSVEEVGWVILPPMMDLAASASTTTSCPGREMEWMSGSGTGRS